MAEIDVNIRLQVLESGNTLVLLNSDSFKPHCMIAHEVKLFWSMKYEKMLLTPYLRPKNRGMAVLITDVLLNNQWMYVGDRGIMIHKGNFLKDSQNCPMPGKLIKGNKLDYNTRDDRALVSGSGTSMEIIFKRMFNRPMSQGIGSDKEVVQWNLNYEVQNNV